MEKFEELKRPERKEKHIDEERLQTIAHWWLLLLQKKKIAPEEIFRKEKEWPRIEEYTDDEIKGLFRADEDENKKFWEKFKEDWRHIEECDDCLRNFEDKFQEQFR